MTLSAIYTIEGVEVADVAKAPALVVWAATKMDIGVTPPQKVVQKVQHRTSVEDQLMIAELRLYKNQKKKKKKI